MTALLTTAVQFERVAKIVAQRVAQLLCAEVFVIDEQGIAIACSNPKLIGLFFNRICAKNILKYLQVPFCFDTQVGEVIIRKPMNGGVDLAIAIKYIV